jgi:predicted Zn-dependent protease
MPNALPLRNLALTILTASSLMTSPAMAAGSSSATPPKPTQTTEDCTDGQVWDEKTKACVDPQSGALDDNTLYGAVREFAYAGQYGHAQNALRAMSDQNDDRVLTYWGFTIRKMGDVPGGMAFYARAIAQNPDNILVRSYMGQALIEQGNTQAARVQLGEIRARGGKGTWSETALNEALTTGKTRDY